MTAYRRHRWRALAAGIVAFGVTVTGACQTPPDDDDRPGHTDTSQTPNRCADVDGTGQDCEDLAP